MADSQGSIRIHDLSEEQILARIVPLLPQAESVEVASGDDCAVLGLRAASVAISTDMLVESTHFRRDWSSGYDVGWRAAAQNLADAVGMGARPVSLVVSLCLPGDLELSWLEDFAMGFGDCARSVRCGVDGGDLTSGPLVVVGVSVLGDLEDRPARLRSGARVGEKLVHTGVLGWSGAGYDILTGAHCPHDSETFAAEQMKRAFRRPEPPMHDAMRAVKRGEIGALMDVSDGLVRDARRIAKASGVWIDIDPQSIERDIFQLELVGFSEDRAEQLVLTGGEDHGFLATCDGEIPDGFRAIGIVREAYQGGRVTLGGRELAPGGGWDHFKKD